MDAGIPSPSPSPGEAVVAPLLELDPSPIDSPPVPADSTGQSTRDDYVGPVKAGSTTQPGLSASTSVGTLSGPGAIFYLTRIQRFSSYAVGLFTSLHLVNVSLIPAITRSVPGSETYLLMTREIYQTSLTEPILVALPVLAHIGSGVVLRWLRRSQNMRRYGAASAGSGTAKASSPWPPLSYISISGYAFTCGYAAHVFMNRLLPLHVEGDSSNIGLAYVAHGFARHPLVAWASYTALLVAGCSHMIWGQAKWLGLAPSTQSLRGMGTVAIDKKTKKQRRARWIGLHGTAAGLMALWAIGGLGVVARGGLTDGWIGKVYDGMFEAVGL